VSLLGRARRAVGASVRALLAPAEDPRAGAEGAAGRERELVGAVRLAAAELRAARERIDRRLADLEAELSVEEGQARIALAAGDEPAARAALRRHVLAGAQVDALAAQAVEVLGEERRLAQAERRLLARIESHRARQQVVAARRDAAAAEVRAGEALTGLSAELEAGGPDLRRAEDQAAALRARVEAIESLVEGGLLDEQPHGGPPAGSVESAVEAKLAELRAERG
jgi:phage shock protein A